MKVVVFTNVVVILLSIVLASYIQLYQVISESMFSTLYGCSNCKNDYIIVNAISYKDSYPKSGDLIAFRSTLLWKKNINPDNSTYLVNHFMKLIFIFTKFMSFKDKILVKRIIATGSQSVEYYTKNNLAINKKIIREPYLVLPSTVYASNISSCKETEFNRIVVPLGRLWVMGDNRIYSSDSRFYNFNFCINLHFYCKKIPREIVPYDNDPLASTIPIKNIIGKAQFIIWPLKRFNYLNHINSLKPE